MSPSPAVRFPALLVLLSSLALSTPGSASPAAPTDLKAVPRGPQRIQLSWSDRSSDETGFLIERRRKSAAFSELTRTTAGATGYSDTDFERGVDDGVAFAYRVRALGTHHSSAPSNVARAVTVYSGEPLHGWLDVTRFGADPDDDDDDTAAIQSALNALGRGFGTDAPHVLYFPSGTYRISNTLLLEGKQAVQLVGDRSGETTIRWSTREPICRRRARTAFPPLPLIEPHAYRSGVPLLRDDTIAMFHSDGSDRSTFRNLTWDANCRACGGLEGCRIVAFDQSYCGRVSTREYQTGCEEIRGVDGLGLRREAGQGDTGSSHIDNTYRDAYVGLRIGHYGVQNSEITVRRARFENNHAGLSIEDANAIQIAVWDSSFERNRFGITNAILLEDLTSSRDCGKFRPFFMEGGNVHVFRSNFVDSLRSDIFAGRENNFTFFDLRSLGSFRFLAAPCKRGATSVVSIVRSRIRLGSPEPKPPDDRGSAIWIRNQGPLFLFRNAIDNSAFRGRPAVHGSSSATMDTLSIGNFYTADPPFRAGPDSRVVSIADCRPSRSSGLCDASDGGDVALHDLPDAKDFMAGRRIYTALDAGSFRDVVHAALEDDAPGGTIVHVPSGTIPVAETLVVPDGSDLVLLGDSEGSRLTWVGPAGHALLEIDGDAVARVLVRDLMLEKGTTAPTGIRVTGLGGGAPGEREVLVTKTVASIEGDAGFVIDEADSARIDFVESGGAGLPTRPYVPGVVVRSGGGPQHRKTFWVHSGGMNDPVYDLETSAGLDVVITGDRAERIERHLRVTGDAGRVVLHSGSIATLGRSPDAILAQDFGGNLSVVNVAVADADEDTGAVISAVRSAAATIQSLANSFDNRSSSDPLQTDHVVRSADDRGNGRTRVTIDRRSVQVFCGKERGDPESDDCRTARLPGRGFRSVENVDGRASEAEARIIAGLEPLRTLSIPHFHDGTGSSAQIHLDHVTISLSQRGLQLEGAVAALLRERFETVPEGERPPGWLDASASGPPGSGSRFRVERLGATRALVAGPSKSALRSQFEPPPEALDVWTAYEYGGRLRTTSAASGIGVIALTRHDDASPPAADHYRVHRSAEHPFFQLTSHSGDLSPRCRTTTRVNPTPETWYRFCLQLLPGSTSTRVRAKIWAQEENEPAFFEIDCRDTRPTRPVRGTVGLWGAAGGAKAWDDLEVRRIDRGPPPNACITAAP